VHRILIKILLLYHSEFDKESNLEWPLVRTPGITNEASSGNILADEKMLKSLKISVEDLTDSILEQITSKDWICKAPVVSATGK